METIQLCRVIGETFPSFDKISGGLAPNYFNLSKELVNFGVETNIICSGVRGQKEFEETNGFRVHRLKPIPGKISELCFHLPFNLAAMEKANSVQKDIFQFHNFYCFWMQKQIFEPNVLTVHGCDVEIYKNVPLWPLQMPLKRVKSWWDIKRTLLLSERMCRNADMVVGVANAVSDEVKQNFGVNKVKTIYNGIDLDIFKKTKAGVFENYPDTFNLLFVGRVVPLKGLEYLFEALNGIDNVKLFIAGEVTGVSKRYFDIILKKINNKNKVVLLGIISNNDLPKYYSSADCFILPTLAEGLPKVVLEAMACGCPVITTDVSGNSEIVTEKTGYLVKPFSSIELRDAIIYLMNNTKDAHKRVLCAKEMVNSKFSWKNAAKGYADLYKDLLI
ncbi:MAG: glycosyltransferase family 4 protein [archaeon]